MSPINPFNWQTLIAINTYIYSLSVHLQHKFMLRSVDPFQIVIALISDMFECHNDPVIRRHTHTHTHTQSMYVFLLSLWLISTPKLPFPRCLCLIMYICVRHKHSHKHMWKPHTQIQPDCMSLHGCHVFLYKALTFSLPTIVVLVHILYLLCLLKPAQHFPNNMLTFVLSRALSCVCVCARAIVYLGADFRFRLINKWRQLTINYFDFWSKGSPINNKSNNNSCTKHVTWPNHKKANGQS